MKLPIISGFDAVKAFSHVGYTISRQTGSHIILYKEGSVPLSVPNHRQLDKGTLRKLIRNSGLTVEEFVHITR